MAQQESALTLPAEDFLPPVQRFRSVRRFVRTQPLGTMGFAIIVLVAFGAIAAPLLHTSDPRNFGEDVLASPSGEHFFGTDRDGKDVWSRVLYGGRVSLKVGLATVLLSVIGGTAIALIAGFVGGALDFVLGRLADILIAFPAILFALTIRTSFGEQLPDFPGLSASEFVLVISIAIIFTPVIYRIMRGAVLEQRSAMYVEAARATGATETRLMVRHLLPNMAGLMIVVSSTTLPAAILTESALSFLGVGVEQGVPSWGGDLSGKARQFFTQAPWIAIFPGLALSLTVLAFNLLGDSLRDTLDPRLRNRR